MAIPDYYSITPDALGAGAKVPILKVEERGEIFYELALEMIDGIQQNNAQGKRTVYILPVGPTGQYPVFVRLVNRRRLDLRNCWFINMDEYLNPDGAWLDKENPLSFRGFMDRAVYGKIAPDLLMPEEQRVFPDPGCPEQVTGLIEKLGGVDIAFGGMGINGHLAFNEARPDLSVAEFADLPTRVLELARETVIANAISTLAGALDLIPVKAVTVGMREILAARKVRVAM
ncbi:MAG: glucosamine-6-phosphate isomerase, partial [Planctomycetes bacterium]|nr:glucosamine-6-phosphate isomerase [Planctomycetota bacterium]